MRGFTAWQFKWEERVAQKQMLASAGARLLKPKLAASFAGWKTDYFTELTAAQSDLAASFPALKRSSSSRRRRSTCCARRWRRRSAGAPRRRRTFEADGGGLDAEWLKVMREAEAKEKRIEELRYKAMKRIRTRGSCAAGWRGRSSGRSG